MLKGFRDFLARGNIVDLAVAVVIGTAFTGLVTKFTDSIIQPLINRIGAGKDASYGILQIGIGGGQIFFWELTTTFVLVSVVFATAVDDAASGHFVSVAPLAIGLSLFACAQASGPFTGGCLNPARFLGPAIVFGCGWPWFAPYVFGQLLGGVLAGTIFRLRLKLQQMYKEHLEEMAARHAAEGGGEADDTPLTTIATPPASAA